MRTFTIILIFFIVCSIQSNSIQKFKQENMKNIKCYLTYITDFKNMTQESMNIIYVASLEMNKYNIRFFWTVTKNQRDNNKFVFYSYENEIRRATFGERNITSKMLVDFSREECSKIR